MWTTEHSIETDLSPSALYDVMSDVTSWPRWNAGVERMELNGPFTAGTTGVMHMPGQDRLDLTLAWVEPGMGFEDVTPIPQTGVVVTVRHTLDALASGRTRITYACRIDGAGSDEMGPVIGPEITADFPEVMASLVRYVEDSTHAG